MQRRFGASVFSVLFASIAFLLGAAVPAWSSYNVPGLPTRWIQGCLVTYASATTVAVTAGSWRDSLDRADVRNFTAVASVDCTVAGAAGIEQTVIANTGSSASPTITANGDVTGNYDSFAVSGTWSSSGTALTGTSTKATTELAVGDLVGNNSKGWSRVTAIASDTSVTVVAALPGGNAAGGSTFTAYYTPTIWIGSTASDKRMVNTISAAGTAIVVDVVPGAISTLSSGQTLTIGVAPNLASEATVNFWLYLWLKQGSSGTTATWSTCRNIQIYRVSGYTSAIRRCAAVPMTGGNATPVLAFTFQREVSPFVRDTIYEDANNTHNLRVLSNGTATTWTQVAGSAVIPPTARRAWLYVSLTSTSLADSTSVREHSLGSSTTTRSSLIFSTSTSGNGGGVGLVLADVDACQSFDYGGNGIAPHSYVDVYGFQDTL